jgi:hypothetical protein
MNDRFCSARQPRRSDPNVHLPIHMFMTTRAATSIETCAKPTDAPILSSEAPEFHDVASK